MNYSKPQILIDLDEYNHLKAIEERNKPVIGEITEEKLSDVVSELIYKTYTEKQIPRSVTFGSIKVEVSEDNNRLNRRKFTFTKL
jgi:hypothetical protein